MPSKRLDLFAITAPGIEQITVDELRGLGVEAEAVEKGRVGFAGDAATMYAANLRLRTASRVVIRIAQFHASSFAELERRAKRVPWSDHVASGGPVAFRVTCRKSRLYHSDAVAERLMTAVARVAGDAVITAAGDDDNSSEVGDAAQLFIVRLLHDEVSISADTSGVLLHKRGYRAEATRASLRETLAAAMLLASEWRPGMPLLDPLCGSGTIPIEAAMIAQNISPGLDRSFAFERWPSFDRKLWTALNERAIAERNDTPPAPIIGGDRDSGAIEISRRNAERAGVADSVEFHERSLAESLGEFEAAAPDRGAIVTNPPYGIRVSGGAGLKNLYGLLGSRVRKQGWSLGILTSDDKLARQSGVALKSAFRTSNGGIRVSFLTTRSGEESGG